jgi:O-antigen/teichoic acid export membrane protein
VGNYAVAVRLSEAWYFIPMAITSSLFPAIINARNYSKELYHARLQKLYGLLTWMSISIALPITFLAEEIIQLLFGGEFLLAAGVFKIYIWSGVFVFLGVASSKHLLLEDLNKISFVRTFLGCLVNIVLNLILIPKVGINGAAWATFISYAVANFSLIVDTRARQIFYMMLHSFMPVKLFNKAG